MTVMIEGSGPSNDSVGIIGVDFMKLISKKPLLFLGVVLACSMTLHAHDIPVHRKITEHVVECAFTYSPAYRDFLAAVASDCDKAQAEEFVVLGSQNEDFIAAQDQVGGNRSVNHFYDPFTGLGL